MHSHALHDARAEYQTSRFNLNRLQAAVSLAQKNYDRMQALLALKAASIQQTEQARQDLLNAQTALHDGQVANERDRIHLEENLGVAADVPLDTHDENADLIPIVAPGSGYILDKMVTPGVTVEPSTDTFVIGELSQVWMLASVRQEDLAGLRLGQPATVTLPGIPGERFPGKITNLGQELDPTTRVMKVRIALNNPGLKLKPEMLATAEIPVGKRKPTLLVPSDAIQQVDGQDVVFVRMAADRFAIRPVRVGETVGDKAPVSEGVKPGDQVVVRGSFILKSQILKSSMENQ
jgi:cobalt-zinc-cadmium efflux system membrane fusion protein